MNPISIIVDVLVLVVGVAAGYFFHRYQRERALKNQQDKADSILKIANEQARLIETQARESATKIVQAAEGEIKERRIELNRETERIDKRRTELDGRADKLEQREQNINKRQSQIDKRANDVDKLYEQEMAKLQEIAQLSQDEAKKELFAAVEKEARADMARIYRQIEAEAREEGEKRARKLIADAIQRVASEHVAEVTSSVVPLPNEEMKGRIVGRNGRNIKAFEQAAGVDVIVDDTPEAVTISCFDSVRREIARRALARLTVDGRIHPAHIEKILEEEGKAVDKIINEAGEQAAFDAGIAGLHPEVLRMIGRLKFRTSYGQNQLAHAVEVSKLAGILAAEIGANVELSKQGGFLHDIGKAMDHNQEGTHAKLGAEYCRRYGVNSIVVNAIESHHHEVDQLSIEAVIAEAADAISGARPGARREDLEAYIKRIRTLEELSLSFE
ncbi:MAG: ribonuclease Y, partial [Chloroflexi bacterium]|nr:ribonuclease Y [Chloroflexota bacterium]